MKKLLIGVVIALGWIALFPASCLVLIVREAIKTVSGINQMICELYHMNSKSLFWTEKNRREWLNK